MLSSIINYITSHNEVIWSGFGIFVLGLIFAITKFFVTHEIIEKSEYKSLQNIKNNTVDVEKLKIGLEFNYEFGFYIDKKSNEKFCPTCLTNKYKKNHLKENITDYGTSYKCRVCFRYFNNKECQQKLDKVMR